MSSGRVILEDQKFLLTIDRLCYQIIEQYYPFSNLCIVGIQPRGVLLSDRLVQRISALEPDAPLTYGKLDITFYRDDFRRRKTPLTASGNEMDFLVEGKDVLIVDDVLYSGRTVQACLTALQHYGRANSIRLLSLVDRRFNRHIPVQADFIGTTVDALDEAYVKVEWQEIDGADKILLFANKEEVK